ncbi:ACT domain-containing protein [Agromyces sp. SYSU T0242]|uniref:ACT domain-containing protein n=1 Tax=Agromyces litoreus TaxID=3158561 RepID=UPI0033985FDD
MPPGSTDLDAMLRTLDVEARAEPYVFANVAPGDPVLAFADAIVVEREGVTAVVRADLAVARGVPHEFEAAWLSLTVHSALEAVGLTAAFSVALGDAGISCNVLAGFHHDHILVPWARRDDAVAALRALRASSGGPPPGDAG